MSLFSWPVPKGRACALECLVLVGFSAWFSVGFFFLFFSFFFPFKESSGNFYKQECKWQRCFSFLFFLFLLYFWGFALMRSLGMGGNGGGASECTKITGVTDGHQR